MKRFLSLFLVIAMLFSVCTIFTACDSTSVSDKEDDDDKKKDDKESKKDTFQGLKIGLPKAYKKDSSGDTYVVYTNGKYNVSIQYQVNNFDQDAKNLQEEYEEGLEDGIDEGYLKEGDAGKTEGKTRYVYAVMADEPFAMVVAFYATDNSIWIVEIMNTEDNEKYDIESMIKLITDWEYSDPEPEGNEDPENPDYPENPNYPEDTQQPTGSVVEPSEPVEQIGNFQVPAEGYDGSPVTITFYHTMGALLQEVLNWHIKEFNKMYPNITVRPEYMGNYDSLHDQIKVEISVGDQPNVAYCYPEHVALYNMANVVVTMDSFMYSDIPVYQANGAAEIMGFADYQLADFFPGFMEGTRVYGDGMSYTLPMSKSTEVLYYNKTFFEEQGLPVPTTWEEMEAVCRIIKEIDPNCIPLGVDSEANLFINYAMQTGGGYIGDNGELEFNSQTNREFMELLRSWYEDGLITTIELNGGYTSDLLCAEQCYMSIGSTGGANYNRGNYELGIAMIPQAGYMPWIISQGPDLCIFQQEDPQEVVASWLFVKFLTTNVEFQAEFSMSSGYMPVIHSAVDNPIYQTYLNRADGYENVTALATLACMEFIDYCGTPNVVSYGQDLRESITWLVYNCMIADMNDPTSEIRQKFDAVERELHYYS